jgi:ribonuclease P protein component
MFNKKPSVIFNGNYIKLAINNSPENTIRILINKKDVKKAVLRNRIKRIILANIKSIKGEKKQFLFKIKPEINNVSKKELSLVLRKEISQILDNFKNYETNL